MKQVQATSDAVRQSMKGNRGRDTGPERALRSAMHRMGLRFRKHHSPFPHVRMTIDAAFVRERVAVFLNGCFWHGCPEHATWPKSNSEFWRTKILGNRERDVRTDELLIAAGWVVIRVWEHEDPVGAASMVAKVLVERRKLLRPGGRGGEETRWDPAGRRRGAYPGNAELATSDSPPLGSHRGSVRDSG